MRFKITIKTVKRSSSFIFKRNMRFPSHRPIKCTNGDQRHQINILNKILGIKLESKFTPLFSSLKVFRYDRVVFKETYS